MKRVTYLVSSNDDPFQYLKRQQNGDVIVDNLVAAKHVRVQIPYPASANLGIVSTEYFPGDSLLDLPFDPPAKKGLYTVSETDSEEQNIELHLQRWGLTLPKNAPVIAKYWKDWPVSVDPVILQDSLADEFELINASAFRITTLPDTNELVVETWFTERTWNCEELSPTELGIFSLQKEDFGYFMAGRVRKLEKDSKSEPVMFRWYPKYQNYGNSTRFYLAEPYGLHPNLVFTVDGEQPMQNCDMYAQIQLPSDLFFDRYQLDDLPSLEPASELLALWGNTDLEKPAWQDPQGSTSLFRLLSTHNATYELPLHTRYIYPTDNLQASGIIPAPFLFWACENHDTDRKLEYLEPQEFLGVSSLFPADHTSFYVSETNAIDYKIPAIYESREEFVENVATLSVIVGAMTVLIYILNVLRKRQVKPKME